MREGRLGYNSSNGRYGILLSDLWLDTGLHCGECLQVLMDGKWMLSGTGIWWAHRIVVIWNIFVQGYNRAQTYRPQERIAPQGARVLLMDGTAVESAFALLLTKVTKPP